MVDVAVQGLIHSEHKPSHTTSFPHAPHPGGSDCVRAADNLSNQAISRGFPDEPVAEI
jgi:hypothetical protein